MSTASFLERSLAYRIDIYILTFLLFLIAPQTGDAIGPLLYLLASCFTALMAFVYLFNKTTDTREDAINTAAGPIALSSIPVVRSIAWGLCTLGFVVLVSLTGNHLYATLYAFVTLLGFAYSSPLRIFGATRRLKQIPVVKTAVSTLIWILPPVLSYMIYLGEVRPREIWLLILLGGLFAAMEICWDIRDMRGDAKSDVRTIPTVFGLRAAKITAIALVFLAAYAGYVLSLNTFSTIGILASLAGIIMVHDERPWWYFHAMAFVWIVLLVAYIFARGV